MNQNEIRVEAHGSKMAVIYVGMALDNNNAHKMVAMITELQDANYKHIVLDMAKTEFLSSAGVGAILGTVEASRDKGGDIVLCSLNENIRHVLKVLDLDDFLTISENQQQALLKGGAGA